MPFGFAGSSACAASFGVSGRTLTASSLSSLLTISPASYRWSNPPEVCVEERGCAGDHGVDPKGSRRGAHRAAVDETRAETCLWGATPRLRRDRLHDRHRQSRRVAIPRCTEETLGERPEPDDLGSAA